jgi:hypothetical protein
MTIEVYSTKTPAAGTLIAVIAVIARDRRDRKSRFLPFRNLRVGMTNLVAGSFALRAWVLVFRSRAITAMTRDHGDLPTHPLISRIIAAG